MTQNSSPDYGGAATRGLYGGTAGPILTGWAGLTALAATLMGLAGGFQIIAGLAALFDEDFAGEVERSLVSLDVTTWGWIHLAFGVLLLLAASALFTGALWARVVGVVVAGATGIVNFAWLPVYPVWGALAVTLSILVILALTVHGRDLSRLDRRNVEHVP